MTIEKEVNITIDTYDNHVDDPVDELIKQSISKENLQSFFMFAGAGSGKTRSLIKALTYLDKEYGTEFSILSKKVAVISYTNAACDEISRRLDHSSTFDVSTIHSFLWNIIKSHQFDIKAWVIKSLESEIADLIDKESKGRGGNASIKRKKTIQNKQDRIKKINAATNFSYNPNGQNIGYDSLNHSEVIKMGCYFLSKEETLQKILVGKYPILFIDESQDTKKELIDALLVIYEKYKEKIIIGMFGDTMQRIYLDGKENLAECIPDDWAKPSKIMNHRSSKRVVALANSIRSSLDQQQQESRSDAETGVVRLFIADHTANKETTEKAISNIMSTEAEDSLWSKSSEYKSLILEHHMAASRLGFSDLFVPLRDSKAFETSLLNGSIPELSFLSNIISPLIRAHKEENNFEILKIIRKHSHSYNSQSFKLSSTNQHELLDYIENSIENILMLWKDNYIPTCIEILEVINDTNIFELSQRVDDILASETEDDSIKVTALRETLSVSFDTLERYSAYITDNTTFATHQGVKGLEFPRVMVIMDDSESKGNLFSYEKLFGAKLKTETDINNEKQGKDNSIARTTRLFYVACTRAEKSLAIVAYTQDKEAVKKTALINQWFAEHEVVIL